MTFRKWIMKQYWRVGTIRALTSLALGMLVLGRLYYIYIPFLVDLGIIGALLLGSFLFFLFLGIGWIYDERFHLWNEQVQAILERNPYQYVPNFRTQASSYPWLYAIITSLNGFAEKLGVEEHKLDDLAAYLDQYFCFQASRRTDIGRSPIAGSEYMEDNPFGKHTQDVETCPSLGARAKKTFQVQILRLGWIQSLTGLFQDVLVLGAFYIALLFPMVAVDGIVPFDYLLLGLILISMPIYIVLLILGWYYDKRLKMWSPETVVRIERNPFSYVPEPRVIQVSLPFFYAYLTTLDALMDRIGADNSELVKIFKHIESHIALSVSEDEDMITARKLRKEFGTTFEQRNTEVQ